MNYFLIFALACSVIALLIMVSDRDRSRVELGRNNFKFTSNPGIRLLWFVYEAVICFLWYLVLVESGIDSIDLVTGCGMALMIMLGVEMYPGDITIDDQGIRQRRIWGGSRYIPWNQFSGVVEDRLNLDYGLSTNDLYICGINGYRIWASRFFYDAYGIRETINSAKPEEALPPLESIHDETRILPIEY